MDHKIVSHLKIKKKHCNTNKNQTVSLILIAKTFFLILRVIWWRIVRLRICFNRYRLWKNQLVSDRSCILCFRSSIVGDRLRIRIVRVVCQHKRYYHCIYIKQNIDSYAVFKNVLMCQTDKTKQKLGILFSINLFNVILLNCSFSGRIDIF